MVLIRSVFGTSNKHTYQLKMRIYF